MARTAPKRWAPHWETIDGVVYMTETGGTFHVDRQQVGYRETRDEDGMLITGDISQKRISMNAVEITGSDGSDFIRLEKDAHSLVDGGAGNDTIKGGQKSDQLHGGAGNDYIRGGGGDDLVYGDAGNDRVTGGSGNDELHGGDGHDFLFGGSGADIMYGGAGDDIFFLKDALSFNSEDFKHAGKAATALKAFVYESGGTADVIMDFESVSAKNEQNKTDKEDTDKIRLSDKKDVLYQNVIIESDTAGDAYTLIFSRDEEDNDVLHGVIKGDVDLTIADFKNARSVSEVDAITIEPWPEEVSDIFSSTESAGDVYII